MSFLAELQRRKVFKVGATYLVVAWLTVQVASIAFPAFDAPPWALRIFILVSLLGFPIAVAMAWVLDATPEGVRLDPDTSGSKRVFAGAAVLIVLALGWYFYGQPSFRKGEASTPVAASQNSVAVLPFANMSGKPDEDYFSDGMTEELLNVLAKVPQLQVVARTSVFEFKGKGGDVRQIGRQLGVSHIVEGSVRRDGQQVRITAQLVRVSDGFHVWSETYDRKLDSVFALQDEIAARIGEQLVSSLAAPGAKPARAAVDPVAYDEYLKGRALLRARSDIPGAIGHFRAATAKAPGFAPAWASLSLSCEVTFWYQHMTPAEQADMLACESSAAERAAALEPDAAASEHALANVERSRFQYAQAERHYLRAMQIDPNYSDVREDYAELLFQVGRVEECRQVARQLVTLDPFYVTGWARAGEAAVALDRRAEVDEASEHAQVLSTGSRFLVTLKLQYALAYGRADEARAELARMQARSPSGSVIAATLLPWALGDAGVDEAKVRALIVEALPGAATMYQVAKSDVDGYNRTTEALGAIRQASYFGNLNKNRATGHAMLRDPRVKAKLVEYGFVKYWREKGWPAVCRPLGDADFECGIDAAGAAKP